MRITPITQVEFQSLISGGEVLAQDDGGQPTVVRVHDGRAVKLFRRRTAMPWRSSYARRFEWGAAIALERGFDGPEILSLHRVSELKRDVAVYHHIPGRNLRQALVEFRDCAHLMNELARLLAHLHDAGIYFRGVHFGNILVQPQERLALIDVGSLRSRRRPLPIKLRARNFRHVLRYPGDQRAIDDFGRNRFITTYLDAADAPAQGRTQHWREKAQQAFWRVC